MRSFREVVEIEHMAEKRTQHSGELSQLLRGSPAAPAQESSEKASRPGEKQWTEPVVLPQENPM